MPTRGPDGRVTARAEGASTSEAAAPLAAHAVRPPPKKDARVMAALAHESDITTAVSLYGKLLTSATLKLERLAVEDADAAQHAEGGAARDNDAAAPALTLDDVGPLVAQAGYRHAADALARVNRFLRGEERIARSCSRLRLGLHGRTRLSFAARVGDVDRCAFLVAHGADVRARDRFGRSALSEAVAGGHVACAAWLRGEGAEEDVAWGGVCVATWGGGGAGADAGDDEDLVQTLASVGGGLLAVSHESGAIHLLDTTTGAVTATLQGDNDSVIALASLPGGKVVSGSCWESNVRVWDVATGLCEAVIHTDQGCVAKLTVLRDGRLATCGNRGGVRLWDLATHACTTELAHANRDRALAALPCGGLAVGCGDGTIALWSAAGVRMATLGGGAGVQGVHALMLLPDGRLAAGHGDHAGGGFDKVVRVWDLQRRALDVVLTGHAQVVSALAALPDGRLLSGSGGDLKVWDKGALSLRGSVSSAQCAATLNGPATDFLFALTMLPDGRVVSGHYGAVRVWR